MNYKDFEGFKKIKNSTNITIEQLYEILKKYEEQLNEVLYDEVNNRIILDINGKYNILVREEKDNIIIEKRLDDGEIELQNLVCEQGKTVLCASADRMVDQVFDLINDYIENGDIKQHITIPKKVLRMNQQDTKFLKTAVNIKTQFTVIDEDTANEIYKIIQRPLSQLYSVENLRINREEAVINYSEINKDKFLVLRHPFENIIVKLDKNSIKRTFISEFSTKKLKVTADFSNNHYLIEINEIVIGAIDCLDPNSKLNYRIEINDLEYEFLVVAIAIIIDVYCNNKKENI